LQIGSVAAVDFGWIGDFAQNPMNNAQQPIIEAAYQQ
jgi:hypothetical protein